MKNFKGRPFFSLFFIARANQKIPNLALGRQSTVHTKLKPHSALAHPQLALSLPIRLAREQLAQEHRPCGGPASKRRAPLAQLLDLCQPTRGLTAVLTQHRLFQII
jgi:hypothetical protein